MQIVSPPPTVVHPAERWRPAEVVLSAPVEPHVRRGYARVLPSGWVEVRLELVSGRRVLCYPAHRVLVVEWLDGDEEVTP